MKREPIYMRYARDVVAGKVVAGRAIIRACERFLNDFKRKDLYFNAAAVEYAINFISQLKHFEGKHAGERFTLEPWQLWIVANIMGWYWVSTNTRRYTSSYVEVARKNGKTALCAALCLLFLFDEQGAQVLLAANSKEQAKICFKMASTFARGLDPKEQYLKPYRADINLPRTNSVLKVLAATDKTNDGYNASAAVLDEYHSAPNSRVRDVIKSSMGMRLQPHLFTITTAGFDKSLPCYQLRSVALEVAAGVKSDDSLFVAVYSLDDTDDYDDPAVWVKANPNLGVTVQPKYLREQVQQAKNNPADEVGVKTKNLNIWCDVAETWVPERYILDATQKVDLSQFSGCMCYVGVDLAAVGDLTAVSYLIVNEDKYIFYTDYYLPNAALYEKPDKERYRLWSQEGALTVTDGNVTDYDYITADLLRHRDNDGLVYVCVNFDRYNATQWAIDATEKGLPLKEYKQTLGNFNGPTRELERALLANYCIIDNNPITRFCFSNVQLKTDQAGNIKPVKTLYAKKIDGVISMIEALGGYQSEPRYSNTIFTI